ncbi:MAG TPA: TIGR01620 family protein [Hyphomicrobiaceae bacterium]|nr:TIGR01620 family protein [Hyphomicrobiaceae bacterium]
MIAATPPRQPRLFSTDDPVLIEEPQAEFADATTTAAPPVAAEEELVRPTLAELGARGWRWGAVFLSAVGGAAALGASAWFMRLVAAALARDDWLGWVTLSLLLIAAFALAMLVLRELIGFSRLGRLNRLRAEVEAALRTKDPGRERRAARSIVRLYAGRADVSWGVRRFGEHARDVRDAGELLTLAEREILVPLDAEARRTVLLAAKRVATVTALSPIIIIAVSYVLVECLSLLRALATLYGGRPGVLGALRLARLVLTHMVATGGIAMTDDIIGQFVGQDMLRRLSRRLGEGAFNGALTARVGVAAIAVIRPLPYLAAKPLRVRDMLNEVLKPLFNRKPPRS